MKVREPSELSFGVVCGVSRGIGVLDGGPYHATEGYVLGVFVPDFGFPLGSPREKCFLIHF